MQRSTRHNFAAGAIIAFVAEESSGFDRWYELNARVGDRRSVSNGMATRAWFRDLYEDRGPVSRAEIDAAFRVREAVIIKRAIASVIEDVCRTTGQRPVAAVDTDPALLITYWSVNGMLKRRCCLSSSAVDELDLFVITARDMQDNIRDDLNEVWPRCRTHHYGMHPGVTDQTPVWWCHYGDGHPVSEIGLFAAVSRSD